MSLIRLGFFYLYIMVGVQTFFFFSGPSAVGLAGTLTKCIYLAHSFTVSSVPTVLLLTVSTGWFWFIFVGFHPPTPNFLLRQHFCCSTLLLGLNTLVWGRLLRMSLGQ